MSAFTRIWKVTSVTFQVYFRKCKQNIYSSLQMLLNEWTWTLYCHSLLCNTGVLKVSSETSRQFLNSDLCAATLSANVCNRQFCSWWITEHIWLVCKMCMQNFIHSLGTGWPLFSCLSQSTGLDNLWADSVVHWCNMTPPPPRLMWIRTSYS